MHINSCMNICSLENKVISDSSHPNIEMWYELIQLPKPNVIVRMGCGWI